MKKLTVLFLVIFLSSRAWPAGPLMVANVTGPNVVVAGVAYTYSYTESFIGAPSWLITSGTAVVNSTWSTGNKYSASVTWTTSGTITFYDEVSEQSSSMNVTIIGDPSATDGSICTPNTSATLTATPGAGASQVRWYAAATGGSALSTSNTYVTPPLTSSQTYYVESWNSANGIASSPRVAVTATLYPALAAPDSVIEATRCGPGVVTLSAIPDAGANSVLWYTQATAGDSLFAGLAFTTPELSHTTQYYVASYNDTTGCISGRTSVRATVVPIPSDLSAWGTPVRYGSGQTDLQAYLFFQPKPGNQTIQEISDGAIDTLLYDVFWYSSPEHAEADTLRLLHGTLYTTPVLTTTTTYYVRVKDNETGCFSATSPAVAEVVPYVTHASIRTDVVRVTGVKTELALSALTDEEKTTTFSYLDGIGRLQQDVLLRASPSGKDLVQPYEYDITGRITKQYLPYADTTTTGVFHSAYQGEQQRFYLTTNDKIADDSAAYAVSVFEQSPRGLLMQQGTVGKGFQPGQGHVAHMQYSFNTLADSVRKFNANGTNSGYYAANTLTKTIGTNADGNYTITFTDSRGQTILGRQRIDAVLEGTYTPYLETYYIYNDLGQVNYIVSPQGTAELKAGDWDFTQTIRDSYCNQFLYDNKGRVIEKKVPGQAWQYIVYDPLGRVVLTQDGLLRADNQWMFIKYNYKGNAVMSGIHTNSTHTTRAAMQSYADGLYTTGHASYGENAWYEKRGSVLEGYTNESFPNSDIAVLSVNYFDDYDFDNNGTADTGYVTESLTGEHTPAEYTFGKPTGSKRNVLGTSTWLFTYVFYDSRGRTIQVQSTNPINPGSLDRVTTAYADDGRVLYTKNYHDPGSDPVTVLNQYEYTTRGALEKISQSNNGSAYQLLVQYEYNELGQLVDKKLHHTGGANFLQSVDYRYTIRGQLKSINNSALTVGANNDDPDSDREDYFGMELLYNESEAGLSTTAKYDGSITAIKWKGAGAESGSAGQKGYAYQYDKTGRLETANYAKKGISWNEEAGAHNEAMTYDHNGNIKTLMRKQRKYDDLTASYTTETIDNLTYAYKTADKNSLEKITDAAGTAAAMGFDNGTSSTNNDYTYDVNGNLLSDKNKGIDSIKYNFLGKPVRMKFSDGKVITYVYDATGNKLTQKLYNGATLQTTTHYVNGFVYEAVTTGSPALSFFGSPEGRVVNNSGTLSYEYSIADHQGNTRVVFTSATPSANTTTVNFESSTNSAVMNYTRTNFELFDHTDVSGSTYTYSQKLTGGTNSQVGVAKTMKVYPGDKVKIEAYAKYYNPTSTSSNISGFAAALTGAFGVTSGSTGEALKAYNSLNSYGGIIATGGGSGSSSYPKLFVNILLFDKDHNFLDAAWEQIDGGEQVGATPKAAHDYMSKEVTVKEAGYAYVFVSNESPTLVEFYVDDVVIIHTPTNVIQYNEYYPFGLQTSSSWTRENTKDNNYLYNAANELNKTNGWYEMFYRGYDPTIGRMLQIDPYATMYASSTTYNYALNNPVMMNDPNGGQASANPDNFRLPAWGSKRIGYGSGNHWSEGIGFGDWSLDGRSEMFDAMLFGGYMPTGGGGFFVQGMQLNDASKYGYSGNKFGYWLEYNTNEPATDLPEGLKGTVLNQVTAHTKFVEIDIKQAKAGILDEGNEVLTNPFFGGIINTISHYGDDILRVAGALTEKASRWLGRTTNGLGWTGNILGARNIVKAGHPKTGREAAELAVNAAPILIDIVALTGAVHPLAGAIVGVAGTGVLLTYDYAIKPGLEYLSREINRFERDLNNWAISNSIPRGK